MNTDKTKQTGLGTAPGVHADRLLAGRAYTLEDVGCYVDGARGVYAINNIASFAEAHGHVIDRCEEGARYAGHPFADEIENEIDDFMDNNYSVEGAYWGRNDQGDWGLWTLEGTIQ